MIFFLLFFFLMIAPATCITAQPGCPDSQALNYDPQAQTNNGSCLYPPTSLVLQPITTLPNELTEISGHAFAGGKWWAHEDGTTAPVFYQFHPENGQIQQEVTLENAQNKDWEEMTSNATHLFLGDFGNNQNNREDLGIYQVPLAAIGQGSVENIPDSTWTFIPFSYPDQTNFNAVPLDSTTFDAEAFIWKNGLLHLFTKNWKTYQTAHYTINPENGTTTLLETFNTDGLVTGAAISPDSQLVVLLGYNIKTQYAAFAWLLWDWPDPQSNLLFTGNKRRINLGTVLITGQSESIAFKDPRRGFIGNERSSAGGVTFALQSLKSFDFNAWVPEGISETTQLPLLKDEINAYPNPFSDYLVIHIENGPKVDFFQVKNSIGQVVYAGNGTGTTIATVHWAKGVYFLEMRGNNRFFQQKMIKW
jgi:hypothetical protein